MGGWLGRGSCLFEDIQRYTLAPSVLGPKFVLGLRSCLFREFPVVDKKKGQGPTTNDPGPMTHDPPTHAN